MMTEPILKISINMDSISNKPKTNTKDDMYKADIYKVVSPSGKSTVEEDSHEKTPPSGESTSKLTSKGNIYKEEAVNKATIYKEVPPGGEEETSPTGETDTAEVNTQVDAVRVYHAAVNENAGTLRPAQEETSKSLDWEIQQLEDITGSPLNLMYDTETLPQERKSYTEETTSHADEDVACTSYVNSASLYPEISIQEMSTNAMEWEDANKASKRKIRTPDPDSPPDSEEEPMRQPKMKPKNRRILSDDDEEGQTDSISTRSQQLRKKQDPPSCSASETESGKRGVGRPAKIRRAVNPEEAESKILDATGVAPAHIREDLLLTMTASDIGAQALEYLDHIETIRTKSGRLQGGLSGELKKRKVCLAEMVRALQLRAESKNDPEFLKHKLGELMNEIKKYKKEEEKRKREVSELQDVIKEMRHENKEIREELRRMKEEVRKSTEERIVTENSGTDKRGKKKEESTQAKKEGSMQRGGAFGLLDRSREDSRSRSPSVVMRPPLGGKSIPIPEPVKQEDRVEVINRQIEALIKIRSRVSQEEQGETDRERKEEKMIQPPLPQRKLRIKENIQLVPPRAERVQQEERVEVSKELATGKEDEWVQATKKGKRKERRRREGEATGLPTPGLPLPPSKGKGEKKDKDKDTYKKIPRRRVPKTAAVCIRGKDNTFSYADALRKARNSISLSELEINSPKLRKGINGATIIEISGPENAEKADRLVAKLQEVLEDAVVTRPVIKGEIRLIGIDDSTSKEEIEFAIAEVGDCNIQEVTVGTIRPTRSGLGTVWARCPLKSAMAVAKKGKIQLGWTVVKTELLQRRTTQCFRCWKNGHTIRACKSDQDFSKCCYKCGRKGHMASTCQYPVRCILCMQLHKDHSHRAGSPQCTGVLAVREEVKDSEAREVDSVDKISEEDTKRQDIQSVRRTQLASMDIDHGEVPTM